MIKIVNRHYPNKKDKYVKGYDNNRPTGDADYLSADLYQRPDGTYYIHAEGGALTSFRGREGLCILYAKRDIGDALASRGVMELLDVYHGDPYSETEREYYY